MEHETVGPVEAAAEARDEALVRAQELLAKLRRENPRRAREWSTTVADISLALQKKGVLGALAFEVALEVCS
jgi:hypothetical protein